MHSQTIYLDNNATSRPAPEVVTAVLQALETDWANPSSVHGFGQTVARSVSRSREHVAELLDIRGERVVFTSGATEANEAVLRHHVIHGAALITSMAEHPAVAGHYFRHAPQLVQTVPLDRSGLWRLDALEAVLKGADGPKLIAFALANGETGVLQDLVAIKALAEHYGAVCLIDASQAVGRVAIEVGRTDYFTFSGHKLHGPKGVGVLVQPEKGHAVEIAAGGGQERGWRGGTLNVPGIVGLGAACDLRKRDLSNAITRMARLRERFETRLITAIPGIRINGSDAPRVPNTTNLTISGVDGMALLARLEARGILCSQVSACSSGQPEPSRTLLAMGLSRDDAFASLRVSVAVDTQDEEVDFAAQALVDEALFLKDIMGGLV